MLRPTVTYFLAGALAGGLATSGFAHDGCLLDRIRADRPPLFDSANKNSVTFDYAPGEHGDHSVAVAIQSTEGLNPEDVLLNGQPLGSQGVHTGTIMWFLLSPAELAAGANEIVYTGGQKSVGDILVFPVTGSEDMHFGKFVQALEPKAQPPSDPLQAQMDITDLDLEITLNMAAATIPSARVTVTATSLDSTLNRCVLDFDNNGGQMVISSIDDGSGTPLSHTYDGVNDRIYIDLPSTVPAGNSFTVRIAYSGTPINPGSGYGFQRVIPQNTTIPIVYTSNQAYWARTWLPCKDLPDDKFRFSASITVANETYGGRPVFPVSNGNLISTVDNGNGTSTFNWNTDYPLASYLLVITCSAYQSATATYTALDGTTTMPVAHYVFPQDITPAATGINNTVAIIDYFAETFGEYPFLDEKYVTAVWGQGFGMEHQTATSMPRLEFTNNTTLGRRNVHELAHMWFGDMVGYASYDHVWLGEGWATYAEALWEGHRNGTAAYHSVVNAWTVTNPYPIVSPNGDALLGSVVYRKGAWVLHMLRRVVGDTAFFQGTRNYLADPNLKYGAALSQDFQAHIEATHGQSLEWFFQQWLYRASVPSYQWTWYTNTDGAENVLHFIFAQTQSDAVYTMPIEMRVNFSDSTSQIVKPLNNQRRQSFSFNVGTKTVNSVTFDPDNWLLDGGNTFVPFGGPPASAPTLQHTMVDAGSGAVSLSWLPSNDLFFSGYRVYTSPDGSTGWTLAADESTLADSDTTVTLAALGANTSAAYRINAVAGGAQGPASDIHMARRSSSGHRVLIVDAWDRPLNEGPHALSHGLAVANHGWPFDTATNEVIGSGVNLTDYDVVIWFCGEESTPNETFSASEQELVKAFLESGGYLFTSGNEIGWDLGRNIVSITPDDRAFWTDYLKAALVPSNADDNSGSYTVNGVGGGIFGTDVYTFGTVGQAPYRPGFPDIIRRRPGISTMEATYATGVGVGPDAGAVISYFGPFGTSSAPGGVVLSGFGFETLNTVSLRNQFMTRVLDAFNQRLSTRVSDWMIVH